MTSQSACTHGCRCAPVSVAVAVTDRCRGRRSRGRPLQWPRWIDLWRQRRVRLIETGPSIGMARRPGRRSGDKLGQSSAISIARRREPAWKLWPVIRPLTCWEMVAEGKRACLHESTVIDRQEPTCGARMGHGCPTWRWPAPARSLPRRAMPGSCASPPLPTCHATPVDSDVQSDRAAACGQPSLLRLGPPAQAWTTGADAAGPRAGAASSVPLDHGVARAGAHINSRPEVREVG